MSVYFNKRYVFDCNIVFTNNCNSPFGWPPPTSSTVADHHLSDGTDKNKQPDRNPVGATPNRRSSLISNNMKRTTPLNKLQSLSNITFWQIFRRSNIFTQRYVSQNMFSSLFFSGNNTKLMLIMIVISYWTLAFSFSLSLSVSFS